MARLDTTPQSPSTWLEQLAVHDLTSLVDRDADSVGRMIPWALASTDTSLGVERASLALRQMMLRRTTRR